MLSKINYKFLCATTLCFTLINSITIQLPSNKSGIRLDFGNEVVAKSSSSSSRSSSSSSSSRSSSSSSSSRSSSSSSSSSRSAPKDSSSASSSSTPNRASAGRTGGRASGGSFNKPAPSPAPVRSNTTTTTKPRPISLPQAKPVTPIRQQPVIVPRHVEVDIDIENEDEDYNPNQTIPNSSTAGSTTNTAPSSESKSDSNSSNLSDSNSDSNSSNLSNSNHSSDDFWGLIVRLGILAFVLLGLSTGIVLLVYFILKQKKGRNAENEQDNDVVTVSTLQVALLGTSKGIQSELSELTLMADTETSVGLLQLLQESALLLLRNGDSWTHVLASSQTVPNREEAEVLFKKFSLQHRSKFSAETLTNVGGRVNRRDAVNAELYTASADYIVVTLLVGTADDRPLFGDVRSVETLKDALEKLGSMRSDYLMVFELLWSPQAEESNLSYDDLLTHYTDMIQIV